MAVELVPELFVERYRLLEEAASGAFEQAGDVLATPAEELTFLLGLAGAWEKREIWYQAGVAYLDALERKPGDPELTIRLSESRERLGDDP